MTPPTRALSSPMSIAHPVAPLRPGAEGRRCGPAVASERACRPRRRSRAAAWRAGIVAATAALVAHAGAGQPLSEAEQAVFLAPHLQALTLPTRLDYRFERRGAEGFEDRVSVAVQARAGGGCCSTEARFLSSARELRLPDLPDAQANPVPCTSWSGRCATCSAEPADSRRTSADASASRSPMPRRY